VEVKGQVARFGYRTETSGNAVLLADVREKVVPVASLRCHLVAPHLAITNLVYEGARIWCYTAVVGPVRGWRATPNTSSFVASTPQIHTLFPRVLFENIGDIRFEVLPRTLIPSPISL
jgi:hypothetical protein